MFVCSFYSFFLGTGSTGCFTPEIKLTQSPAGDSKLLWTWIHNLHGDIQNNYTAVLSFVGQLTAAPSITSNE